MMLARGILYFNGRTTIYPRISPTICSVAGSSRAKYRTGNIPFCSDDHRFTKRSLLLPFQALNFTTSGAFTISERHKQSSSSQEKSSENELEATEKLSLFQRYKKMLKEYWYVLLPVHCVTSVFWFGGFYYAAKCGIDIVPFLEYINLPAKYIDPLRNSSLGSIAVASAFYKLATPARYMVTVGGTTVAVKVLTKRGLIRPAPTKSELKTMIQNKLKKEPSEKQA